jgi:hypothetical protein
VGVVVKRAEDLEVCGIADGGFHPEHASGFVVHLDGVASEPVLDANPLGAVLEAGDDLPCVVAGSLLSKEPHHVGALA